MVSVPTLAEFNDLEARVQNLEGYEGLKEGNTPAENTSVMNALSLSAGDTVTLPSGTFQVDDEVVFPAGVNIVCDGMCMFDARNATGGFSESNAVLSVKGEEPTDALPSLSMSVSKGSNVLPFAASHGLVQGDIVFIYNPTDYSFSHHRPTYRAGEYATVQEAVDSKTVRLDEPLWDDYAVGVDLYKMTRRDAIIKGVGAYAPDSAVRAVSFDYLNNVTGSDIRAFESENAAFLISRSYRCIFDLVTAEQYISGPSGTHYGLVVASSQSVRTNGNYTGYRHAIAQGGMGDFSIPCRDLSHSGIARNLNQSDGTVDVLDFHGNCEYCEYRDVVTYGSGGINMAGNHNRVSGWKGFVNTDSDGQAVIFGEITGLDHVIENFSLQVYGDPEYPSPIGVIDLGGGGASSLDANTERGGNFTLRNGYIHAPDKAGRIVQIRNRGFTGKWSFTFSNIEIDAPNSDAAVWDRHVSGSRMEYLRVYGYFITSSALRFDGFDNATKMIGNLNDE